MNKNIDEILRKKRVSIDKFHESYESRLAVVANSPLEIFLEVCNTCNISCKMCLTHNRGWQGTVRFMPAEVYESSYPLLENAIVPHPFGFGEPLLHKKFKEIVKFAKSQKVYVDFFTNATLLNKNLARFFVEEGVDRIFVSFDGATKETYEAIHRGAKYEKVVENLRFLHALKKRLLKEKPEIVINFIVMQSNFRELPDLLELANSWGLHCVELKSLVTYDFMREMESERKYYEPEKDSGIMEKCREIAQRYNIGLYCEQFLNSAIKETQSLSQDQLVTLNIKRYIEAAKGRPYCSEPFRTIYVKSDGNVKPCCFHQEHDFLGNTREQSLLDIWNGDKFVQFRQKIINEEIPKACIPCIRDFHKPMYDNCGDIFSIISRPTVPQVSADVFLKTFLRHPFEKALWEFMLTDEFQARAKRKLKSLLKQALS